MVYSKIWCTFVKIWSYLFFFPNSLCLNTFVHITHNNFCKHQGVFFFFSWQATKKQNGILFFVLFLKLPRLFWRLSFSSVRHRNLPLLIAWAPLTPFPHQISTLACATKLTADQRIRHLMTSSSFLISFWCRALRSDPKRWRASLCVPLLSVFAVFDWQASEWGDKTLLNSLRLFSF